MSSPFRFGERGSVVAPQHVRERFARRQPNLNAIHLLETWDRQKERPRSHFVCILGSAIALPEHWDDSIGERGQHVPCSANCPRCQYELPEDHAWLPAVYLTNSYALRDRPQYCFCHVGPAAAASLAIFDRPLRSKIFLFERKPHPTHISIPGPEIITEVAKTLKDPPESFDVLPYVTRLWKNVNFQSQPSLNGHISTNRTGDHT